MKRNMPIKNVRNGSFRLENLVPDVTEKVNLQLLQHHCFRVCLKYDATSPELSSD